LLLAHDPEKLTDFSDKIMRKDKKMESKIASIRSDLARGVAMEDKLRAIMGKILRLPAERIGPDAAIGNVPNWDSTAHMRIMLALEDEFGVELNESQMVEMTSLAKIRAVVEELRAAKDRPRPG
jgi:acyl carrier protein